ncbi:MAG: hypothetical protein OEU50_20860 [Gammaproteobacteria bacterium]|nr:hypothetical protein [Gammaproteobacteria bacterium]
MVTYNALETMESTAQVNNVAHQHAFVLVGQEQLFGVHMTQYHCELHKYQIILKLHLPKNIYLEYMDLRAANPDETFVLCNAKNRPKIKLNEVREFCIPDLGSGMVTRFTANIFQGIRPLSPAEVAADTHFFPWAKKYVKPAIGEFEVKVERVVLFRPFDHLQVLPTYARYFLFGDSKSGEAHMTNLQTAMLVSDRFEPDVFGPDYDHVLSLQQPPAWLEQAAMLEAGVVVTTPIVRLVDADTGLPTIPDKQPFTRGAEIEVLYRGVGPSRSVIAGPSYSYCTAVCNSPRFFVEPPSYDSYLDTLPDVAEVFDFSPMPKRYWNFPQDD